MVRHLVPGGVRLLPLLVPCIHAYTWFQHTRTHDMLFAERLQPNIHMAFRIAGATALNGVHYHAHPVGVAPNCLKVCILTDCSHTHASRVFSGL